MRSIFNFFKVWGFQILLSFGFNFAMFFIAMDMLHVAFGSHGFYKWLVIFPLIGGGWLSLQWCRHDRRMATLHLERR